MCLQSTIVMLRVSPSDVYEAGLRPELRRGCVSQFSDEEVLAMQLNTAEMEAQGNTNS